MSMSNYLWTTARNLRTKVHPAVASPAARDSLDNAIRILTAVANALEGHAPASIIPPRRLVGEVDIDRINGPAENAAAFRDTAGLIATIAGECDAATAADLAGQRSAIAWEKTLMDAAVARYDSAERLPPGHESAGANIDPAALEAYLRKVTGHAGLSVTDFRQIPGGRSRQTALVSISNAPGLASELVVQRGIPGQIVPDIFLKEAGQFELISMVHAAGMRVPKPVLVETDPGPLGAAFLLFERVSGTTAQADYWTKTEPESVVLALAREMAVLHAQPIDVIGPKMPQSRQRYDLAGWTEELEALAAAWHSRAHWPSITMSAAIAWMRANVGCLDDRRSIVHNDMIFHNVLVENGAITAVLDWEQASIGHPGEDLGYCFPVVSMATDWDAYLDAYRAAGGPPVTQRQIDYFALRGGLRLMNLVILGGRDSYEGGHADDVLVASAGAHFTQRLLHRIAQILESVLERN